MNNRVLQVLTEERNPGVIISNCMKPSKHGTATVNKANLI